MRPSQKWTMPSWEPVMIQGFPGTKQAARTASAWGSMGQASRACFQCQTWASPPPPAVSRSSPLSLKRETKGQANPAVVNELLARKLG